jgi:hypothetical protein
MKGRENVNTHMYNLTNALFDGYKTEIRPILDHNLSTNITIDFTLIQIIEMVIL